MEEPTRNETVAVKATAGLLRQLEGALKVMCNDTARFHVNAQTVQASRPAKGLRQHSPVAQAARQMPGRGLLRVCGPAPSPGRGEVTGLDDERLADMRGTTNGLSSTRQSLTQAV